MRQANGQCWEYGDPNHLFKDTYGEAQRQDDSGHVEEGCEGQAPWIAAAAALAVAVFLYRTDATSPAPPQVVSRAFQFVLVAPRAAHVSLVGDFNDWDATRTPMRQTGSNALWTVVVPLEPGRYHYAFFVDGSRWLADPSAPVARDDDYGAPSSVLTVGGGGDS